MIAQDNQRDETASPVDVRDRHVAARRQAETNAPLTTFPPLVEDVQQQQEQMGVERGRVVAATREATQRRLRLQSEQLKRFHQQICLRVNERVLAQRAHQQSHDKRIDAKLARLLQVSSVAEDSRAPSLTTNTATTTSTTPRALHLSRTSHMDVLLNLKRDQLQGAGATLLLVDKALRSDAQAREMLLGATRMARARASRSCEAIALDELYADEDNQTNDDNGREGGNRHGAHKDDVMLPAKQRTELYAAVRRRYMAIERERVKQRVGGTDRSSTSAARSFSASSIKGGSRKRGDNTPRAPNDERRTDAHVKVVDVSTGCEIKLRRQTARTSSTPWRNSPSPPPPRPPTSQSAASSAAKSHVKATTHDRFLTALQEQLGTPALCSCGGQKGRLAECANNCEFYRQPKRKGRAAASVCKQHESAT